VDALVAFGKALVSRAFFWIVTVGLALVGAIFSLVSLAHAHRDVVPWVVAGILFVLLISSFLAYRGLFEQGRNQGRTIEGLNGRVTALEGQLQDMTQQRDSLNTLLHQAHLARGDRGAVGGYTGPPPPPPPGLFVNPQQGDD